MYGYGPGPQDGLFMLAMMTLMTVLTAVAVVAVVRSLRSRGGSTQARQVLDQRYARGELSSEEYRERLDRLSER